MSQSPTVAELALQATRYPSATRTVVPTPWIVLPLVPPWAAMPGLVPSYKVDAAGNVELRGSATGGGIGPLGQLPANLGPPASVSALTLSLVAGPAMQTAWIGIEPVGLPNPGRVVLVATTVGAPVEVRMDGVRFSIF